MKIILLSLLITSVFAKSGIILRMDNNLFVEFQTIDGFIVNSSCHEKQCLSIKKAKEYKKKNVSSDLLQGGKNPSAVKCKSLLGGKVIIAKDLKGNEQNVCWFSDDSYLL